MIEQPVVQRFGIHDLEYIRPVLRELYEECYALNRYSPFFTQERFLERLADHAGPGWEATVAYSQGAPVGYAYGCPLPADTAWWERAEPSPSLDLAVEDGQRTFAVLQLMVRERWRGAGLARRLHDELLGARLERRTTLLVESDHPKVRSVYEQWGYTCVAGSRPYSDGPTYDIMVRDNRSLIAPTARRSLPGSSRRRSQRRI